MGFWIFDIKFVEKVAPFLDAKNEGRGGSRGGRGGRGGRGAGRGFGQDSGYGGNSNSNNASGGYGNTEEGERKPFERRDGYGGSRGSFERRGGYGGRRGGFSNGDGGDEERPRRVFDRHSGTGHGNDFKREGSGRGNWGTAGDEIARDTEQPNENEKKLGAEKFPGEEDNTKVNSETPATEAEKEPEDKEMTLEEYEKIREEKRKALEALKTEERKVEIDKELKSMRLISNKKQNDEIFVKLGSDKDKRKEISEKEERAKKSLSINEFLKPTEEERNQGGRGRGGRARGPKTGYGGGNPVSRSSVAAPSIEDQGEFPTLGGK
ncbi:hypothetical protein MKX01_028384 [Papaver californicum]|nr:hypothetical protein MKX01_028384 [Papaver californicum]